MSLFSIQCTTCHSRLKVRDEAAIGQILSCPKCNSMVLVEAPADFSPSAPTESDSSESYDAQDAAAPHGSPSQPVMGKSYDSRADTKPLEGEAIEELMQSPATSPPAPQQEEEKVILPGAEWSSSEARQLRKVLMISGVAVALVVIAVAIFGFIAADRSSARAPNLSDPINGAGADPTAPTPAPEIESDGNDPNSKPNGSDPETPADPASETPKVDPAGGDPESQPAKDPAETQPSDAGGKPSPKDPGDFTPELTADDPDPAALAKSLEALENLLSPDGGGDRAKEETVPKEPEQPIVELFPRPKQRKIDVKVQLAREIPSIEFDKVPLLGFVRFVGRMSTIPITIDPEALQAAGVSPLAPLAVRQTNATVEQLLRESIKPLNLDLRIEEDRVAITLPNADEMATEELDIADLTGGSAAQVQQITAWVGQTVAPESWRGPDAQGGAGRLAVREQKLTIENLPAINFQVKRMLDRLRAARGLATKYELSPTAMRIGPLAAPAKLNQKITANFRILTDVGNILEHLGAESSMSIVVDWKAVAAVGWNQDGQARLNVANVPLAEALEKLVVPMELAYRVIGDDTIQITTPAAVFQKRLVVFYPTGELAAEEDAGANLVQLLEANLSGGPKSLPTPAFVFDPVSRHIIVSACGPHQMRAAKVLKELGSR